MMRGLKMMKGQSEDERGEGTRREGECDDERVELENDATEACVGRQGVMR